ncbi:glutamate--tRNA ligase [Candidatus Marinarcus aquaticus]|uniref:Glutamate--tRNA ligase n=1 Tax=Candidatus Marinarcus aquaticus TaxID=2044504 RepID=A0A4Q0XTC7_9BACT|nr:glutamate--tRNA ligase [Candidatus Marinarcus aquaticus]RXJ60105.1 glutamate--tRNA ligase [Candidatus Marinarcus aquaticus]
MFRFAVSPTEPLSINSLRIALLNYIVAQQHKEELVLRIDDTDKELNIENCEKEIQELLTLFSIGHSRVIFQSENLKYHQKMAMQLLMQKKAFSCFCSQEKLDELKEEAQQKNTLYSYDGFCATLSDETVLNVNAPFTIRMQKPTENIEFSDSLQGSVNHTPDEIDAFIILKHDKTPTYNYACAVDDMLYDISTIIRSSKHLLNTTRQIHIQKALGYNKVIAYTHCADISCDIKEANSVKYLIDEGFLPAAIANYLVLLGSNAPKEIFTLEEALEWFDINSLSKENLTFDINKLKEINKQHIETMGNMRLSKIIGFADEDIGKLSKLYLNNCSTIKEIKAKMDAIFAPKKPIKKFKDEFPVLKEALEKAPYFENFDALLNYLKQETQFDLNDSTASLCYILTGNESGPSLDEVYPFIKNYLGEIVK